MEKETTMNELMDFLKDTMATKDDLKNLATKDDIKNIRAEMATKSDLEQLRHDFDAEFTTIKDELADIKVQLTRLEKRTREDADAAAKDILELRSRVQFLETQVKQLQGAG